MKRKVLPFLTLAIISTSSLTAQVQKGDILLGATLGFNYGSNNDNYSTSNSNIAPRVAIGIGSNSALGLKTGFTYQKYKPGGSSDETTTTTGISAGLFWRKYMPIKNKIGWYLEPNGGVSFNRDVRKSSTNKIKGSSTQYNAKVLPGIYYQPIPKLLINADFGGLGYNYSRSKSDGNPTNRYSNVYLNLFSTFTFGFDFIL